MLPLAPLGIALLALGVATLSISANRFFRWGGLAVAVVALIAVGSQTRSERTLFATNSYFLESANRTLLANLPRHPGPVDLEGFGVSVRGAVPELTDMYSLLSEDDLEVSVPNEAPSYNQFKSLGTENYINPEYRYILTRFGGVQTTRRTIARVGPLALEERVGSLDVTLVSGALTSLARWEPEGLAQISEPLHLLLVGDGPADTWILLRFSTIAPASAPSQPGVRALTTPHTLTICVRPTGRQPVRRATLILNGRVFPGAVPAEPFAEAMEPRGIQLVAMHAATRCPLRRDA